MTDKLVFSFVDVRNYQKVKNSLVKETPYYTKESVESAEPTENQIKEIAEGLVKIREQWHFRGWHISFATCAESIDLEAYGIEHNGCVDRELMKKIFPQDADLQYYLSYVKLPDSNSLFDH